MTTGTKGMMGGSMKFFVGDEGPDTPAERTALLPLRLVILSDLIPRSPHNAGASPPDAPLRVDPARFDDLFDRLRLRIAIDVPSVLAEGRNARLDLAPTSLKSFRPDGLCAELPLLRSLLDGRTVLDRLRDGSITTGQARTELERLWKGSSFVSEILGLLPGGAAGDAPARGTSALSAQASGAGTSSILDMVDLGGSNGTAAAATPAPAAAPARSGASDIIAQFVRSARSTPGVAVHPGEALARIDRALGAQIGAILQHPEVRRLEAAWRGLRLLADRAQGHGGVRLEVVCCRPDEAPGALARALGAAPAGEPPVSCAIVDLEIDGSALGFARLEAVAAAAEEASVPCVLNATPGLLGVADLAGVERLDHKAGLFQATERLPWRSAVGKPNTRWVTLAMNPLLGRIGYEKATSRVREAAIVELPSGEPAKVYTAPAYAVGALLVSSFRDTGWPCRITGLKSGGTVENLPVHELASGYEGAEGVAVPTEAFVSTDTQRELARVGVLALASAPNSDAVYVLHAPTAYVPPDKKTYDSESTEPEARYDRVTLGDQLFVARLVQFLRALCSGLPGQADPGEVRPVVEAAVWSLFEDAKPGTVELEVKASSRDGQTFAAITVRPRRFLGVALEEIGLELPLG